MILDSIAKAFLTLAGVNVNLQQPAAAVLSYGLLDATTNDVGLYFKNGVLYNRLGVAILTVGAAAGLTFPGPLIGSTIQSLSGAGAVDIVSLTTEVTSTGANALTLADGTAGQIKIINMIVDGGDATLTPTTKTGYSTIVFNDAADSVILQFHTTYGWLVLGSNGPTIS